MVFAVVLGVATALLLVAQAWLLAAVIAGAFAGSSTCGCTRRTRSTARNVVLARAGRTAWLSETVAARCSARVKSELRAALLARAPAAGKPPGAALGPPTRGIDALDGYFARYLPQLALAALIVPVVRRRGGVRATGSRPRSSPSRFR